MNMIWAAQAMTKPGALMARLDGKAFWVARYRHRDDIYEWEVDWSELPRRGLTELILVCPNSQIGVIGNLGGKDMQDRFFQLKVAVRHSYMESSILLAQIIGRLDGSNGECTICAWEPAHSIPTTQTYQEPANDGTGGIVWRERIIYTQVPAKFVGPIQDNFFDMQYQKLSGLSQDVLGVK